MIVEFALAIGVLAPFSDVIVQPIPVKPEDCVKATPIPKPAELPRKRVVVKHKHPGVAKPKAEPKPVVEEDCGEGVLPPAPTLVLIPQELEFSPVPEIPFAAAQAPDDREVGIGYPFSGGFAEVTPGAAAFITGPCCCDVIAAPVPEPGTWLLLAGGFALVWRKARA